MSPEFTPLLLAPSPSATAALGRRYQRQALMRRFWRALWLPLLLAATLVGCMGSSQPTISIAGTPMPTVVPELPLATPQVGPLAFSAPPPAAGDTFVFLFEWSWTAVALECERFLGPQGYAAVLVSPPNEHALIRTSFAEFPWWQRYQPVSYRLDRSRSGTRAEFAEMVARCQAVGVAVYVDAVLNHMAANNRTDAQTLSVGSAGSVYDGGLLAYPGVFSAADFNSGNRAPCSSPTGGIGLEDFRLSVDPDLNRQRAQNLWYCALDGLPDLDLSASHVRRTLAAYLSELVQLGVAGFRIDSARHIPPDDLNLLFDLVNQQVAPVRPFYFLEISDLTPSPVSGQGYLGVNSDGSELPVAITEFRVGAKLGRVMRNENGATLANLRSLLDPVADANVIPPERRVIFVDNHDTQRNKQGPDFLTYRDDGAAAGEGGQRLYTLANIVLLALPGGYPQIMSGYAFEMHPAIDPFGNGGPPADWAGNTLDPYRDPGSGQTRVNPRCFGTTPGKDWVCEHRWAEIAAMVSFRKAVAGANEIHNWWDNGANQIAFGVGQRGFVALNREAQPLDQIWATGLPDGVYCDILDRPFDAVRGSCGGRQVLVRDGLLYAAESRLIPVTLDPYRALAIHVGAKMK